MQSLIKVTSIFIFTPKLTINVAIKKDSNWVQLTHGISWNLNVASWQQNVNFGY